MRSRLKVVSPYRPFAWESPAHRKLGPFDWVGALEMLRESVRQSCRCETVALTDVDTTLPGPMHQYGTTHRRLMLWLLEVTCCYLESEDFTCDTVLVSPDMLVFRDLRPWFLADLGVLVRSAEKYRLRPLLNGVQWFRHAAKDRLAVFYREALALAVTLPENAIRWGADTEPLVRLLWPLTVGLSARAGLSVQGIEASEVLWSMAVPATIEGWVPAPPSHAVTDFKFHRRKKLMRAYYDATIGSAVPA